MRDNNGISGQAFMGSLPFITAAKMTDNRGYKVLVFTGSAIAALSRVNDNAHYPLQVALGGGWLIGRRVRSTQRTIPTPDGGYIPIQLGTVRG